MSSTTSDTSHYDPIVHDNQIVAMYETDAKARAAEEMMRAAGFPASSMQVLARDGATAAGTTMAYDANDEGLWGSIKSLFVPDEDRTTYSTAIARGHAMLVVTPDRSMDRQHLINVLESTDPLDFDVKHEEWRQDGHETIGTATGVAAMGGAALNTAATVATAGRATQPVTAMVGDAETIKVMQERLRVGKREVSAGAVRIRSYIVERPVEESVRLREEHISVERRPVDRVATAAEFGAFQERTIEARATSEEAVISKEAHVVEEIGVKKTVADRSETVRDTVRETKVEVQDDTLHGKGTLPGTVAGTPSAIPGAGTNTPRT